MNLGWLWVVVLVFFLFAVVGKLKQGQALAMVWPFYAKKLMTSPEQVLYWRLVKALPAELVLAQVQLSRILGVKKGFRFHEWNNRVNRLSADFVICAPDSTVLAVIELDDATHLKPDRVEADARKDRALHAAGVRVIRWKVSAIPDESLIRLAIHPPSVLGGASK